MSTDPFAADPADVAEQQQDVVPETFDEEAPRLDRDDVPLDADELDFADQHRDVPSDVLDDDQT